MRVISPCLLLDNEFKQLLGFDILGITREQSGIDIEVVNTLVEVTLKKVISSTRDTFFGT